MSMIIQANMPFINAQNKYKVSTEKRATSAEKLASGYRINRAADDAAGLSISEKLRSQIRGLNRGASNGQDGISWVQTGDGALNEVHDILHRMRELTVQALNDTNSEEDRAALQAEVDSLQSEIDRITDTTQFNEKNIFAEHEPVYYQYEGNMKWNQSQIHVINAGANSMTIKYAKDGATTEDITIEVPAGEYTTQELTDEIDDILKDMGVEDINVEYTDQGTFNVNLEGGEHIEEITGALSKLLYDSYDGGSAGALIGTTSFPNDVIQMTISGENNNLAFDVEYFDGRTDNIDITLPTGRYSRPQVIDALNARLAGTGISAQAYGSGIKLGSNDAIITGFKGNMFKIDGGVNPYTSVFYDNVKYGNISTTSSKFIGGTVIPNSNKDAEHHTLTIGADKNELTFKANGSDTPVTIAIPEGEYTIQEMRDKLNELFTANNLELNAVVHESGGYSGITINSLVKGAISEVGLSTSSSGYNTIFVERVYNSYSNDAVFTNEETANRQAYFTGSKAFTGTNPLTVTEDNNEFVIKLDNAEYNIKIANGTYNTADELRAEIDSKLNGGQALSGYKNLINVSVDNNCIKLTTTADSGVVAFEAKAAAGDMGYDNIFVGKTQVVTQTTVSATGSNNKPEITLNTPLTDPATITDADKNFTIKVNGVDRPVTLPTGNVTHDQIIEAINNQVARKVKVYNNSFTTIDVEGDTVSNHFTPRSILGDTVVTSPPYGKKGTSSLMEGSIGFAENIPASETMTVALPASMVIDDSNNSLQLNINGSTRAITLTNKTYSRTALVSELQTQIDKIFGKGEGGAIVSLTSDNKLKFTARMEENTDGNNTYIGFSTTTSSFIRDLHTTETPGYTITGDMKSSITITDDSREFNFNYVEDGVAKTANITLAKGTYSRSSFINMLNQRMRAEGVNVTASAQGNAIKLSTNTTGNDRNTVMFSTTSVGNSVEAVFGPMTTLVPAKATVDRDIQQNITIDGTTDVFNIKINGTNYNLKLDHGDYNRSSFVQMLNNKMSGTGAKVTLDGNKLKFETEEAGSDKSIYFKYTDVGSSKLPIFGQLTEITPGVTASFNSDNKLVITGTDNFMSLSVSSSKGSVLQEPQVTIKEEKITRQTGYYSSIYAKVDGKTITEPVKIDEWNDELNFVYKENGNSHSVSMKLDEKEYTFDELRQALQDNIDAQIGAGELTVDVTGAGVVIKANNPGNKYSFNRNDFSGDFFYKVMNTAKEVTANQRPTISNGTAPKDTAYTVGRKDVRNKSTEIKAGINDTLSLDFTYGNTTTTFTVKLDPGTYSGQELKNMLQEKLNDEVVKAGLSENIIEVGIGGISTGVVGANDNNALNFQLSKSVRLPADGTYVIDGVKGNAAFSIFYQTDGELVPAYVKGAKDLTEGVTIESGKQDFSMDVEGTNYSISLEAKKYTVDEILTEINGKLGAAGAPVTAELEDGILKFSHNKLGERKIENVTGGAKQALFFNENGEKGEKEEIRIQMSSRAGDYITIDRPILNTVKLGVNSIAITSPKYANKALVRIDEAINHVSQVRSDFGAKQNRLEFAVNSNKNTSENTQAAESLLRDTDMAEEMLIFSKESIIIQAGEAMMAQANSLKEGVLALLS